MGEQTVELTDEQLCALNVIVYNKKVCEQLAHADVRTSLREIISNAGETYYDELEWECGLTRNDWYDYVRVTNDTNLGDLHVMNVGTGIDEGSFCFEGQDRGGYYISYVVFRGDNGTDSGDALSRFGPTGFAARTDALSYASTYAYAPLVVTGHGEGGAKALEVATAGMSLEIERCVAFDARAISPLFLAAYRPYVGRAARSTTHYHTVGDVVNPGVADLAGTMVALAPSLTDAGYVRAHSLASLLKGASSFGPRVCADRANDGVAAQPSLAELIGVGSAARQGVLVAMEPAITDFLSWLAENASEKDLVRITPLLNQVLEAACGRRDRKLNDLISADTATAGVLFAYLLRYPKAGLLVGGGSIVASKLVSMTGADLAHVLGPLLEACGISSAVQKRIASAVKRNLTRIAEASTSVAESADLRNLYACAGIHDFSDERRDELLSIIAEIDSEPWYDVGRWDLWYRLERAVGHLKLANYQNDVRSYYRKTLDIAGTTAEEVRQRFVRAHELASNLALQLDQVGESLDDISARVRNVSFDL